MRRRLGALALVLTTGCGLPLSDAVQQPRQVPAGQQQRGDIQVLPPGPREDNAPEQVVRGFFGAQSNPEDGHASARAFLTPERRATWDDTGQVTVFEGALQTSQVGNAEDVFEVSGDQVGRIDADGSYTRATGRISFRVRLVNTARTGWALSDVPDGLLLSTADRDRSFRSRNVYFLAPSPPQAADAPTHLVPDPVFIPVTADPAQALVERLLAGPSRPLGDSVETAVPDDTALRRPVATDASGVVTVDLTRQVADAPALQKEQLSAQLVWTLREVDTAFSKLRLQSDGRALVVPTASDGDGRQDRGEWAEYDPDGLTPRVPAYYVAERRLRSLDGALAGGPASDEGKQLVDVAAVSTRGGTLAVLTDEGREWVLRTGPVSGPFDERWRGTSLGSPSWGSGDQGVWFVDRGRVRLAPPSGRTIGIPIDGINAYGPVTAMRVSRDGARIALVAGVGTRRQLVIGRVRATAGQVRVVALRAVAPGVRDVRDVSWDSSTSVVVLGTGTGSQVPLPIRVAIDGSSVVTLQRVGLERSEPLSLTAAPNRQLVVAARLGRVPVLFRDNGRQYVREAGGSAPFYPG